MENVHPADRPGEQVFSAFQTNLLVGIWDFFTFTFFSHSQYDHLSIFLVLTTMISMFFGGYAFLDDRTNRPYHFHFFHTCLRVYVHVMWVSGVCVCLCLWHVWCTHLMAQSCWWLLDSHNNNPHALIPPFLSYQLT